MTHLDQILECHDCRDNEYIILQIIQGIRLTIHSGRSRFARSAQFGCQMRMTHDRKIEEYKRLMAEKGIGPATASPPLWQLFSSMGLPLPPPLYMPFLPLALVSGTFFGLVFGAFAWYMGNKGIRTMSFKEAGDVALITGALFGISVAWLTRRLARKHGLGTWSALGTAGLRT